MFPPTFFKLSPTSQTCLKDLTFHLLKHSFSKYGNENTNHIGGLMRAVYALLVLIMLAGAVFSQQPAANVVAKVNDIEITAEDILQGDAEKNMMTREHMTNASGQRRQRDVNPEQAEWMLDQTINSTLMLKEAEAAGMADDPDVKSQVEAYQRAIMVQNYIDKVLYEQVKPSEEEIRAEYDKSDRYMQQAHAKIIRAWGNTEEEVRNRLQEMKGSPEGQAHFEKMHFQELEYMRDMSADGSGRQGNNRSSEKDAHFTVMELVRDAKAGSTVGPIEVGENQWTMVEVVEQVPAGKRPFDEVREDIERNMVRERLNQAQQDKIQELRKSAVVTIYYENLNKAFEN